MKKRRFLSAVEANELSRQLTYERVTNTPGLVDAANQKTDDPELTRIFEVVKKASTNTAATSSRQFGTAETRKKLAGVKK